MTKPPSRSADVLKSRIKQGATYSFDPTTKEVLNRHSQKIGLGVWKRGKLYVTRIISDDLKK